MAGHDADEAKGGFEAIQMYQNKRYDVVITDAEMPNIDGVALCRYLRTQTSGIYIIGISGSFSALERLVDAGADICLSKPFGIQALENAIESRLHVHRHRLASDCSAE
jgi:two-component system capsular synthesis sensor histidine kinase RcsC